MEQIEKPEKPSALKLVTDFGDTTSMPGVGRALNSKSIWKRVAWSVLVLCGTGLAVYQVTDVVLDFYRYPVVTVVTLKHESQMEFPAITICNINTMRSSKIPDEIKEEVYTVQLERSSDHLEKLNAIVRSLSIEDRSKSGHEMSDMLVSCMYNRKPCSVANFSRMHAGIYGTCQTFVIGYCNEMYITRPGPQNGLVIEMTIQHSEYTSLSSQAGLNVIVHNQEEAPFPEDGGILVQPGMSTSIAIKKTVTHRLPLPYGECITTAGSSSSFLSLYEVLRYIYTENACRKSCYQLSLIQTCGCCDDDLPCDDQQIFKILRDIPEDIGTIPYCNTSGEVGQCISEVEASFLKGKQECLERCSPACDQTTYETTVSSAVWPSDPYLEVLMHHASKTVLKNHTFDSPDDLRKFIPKNFLKLEIFYEKLDFLEVATKPMYEWSSLLGNIGGHLGLWLGISILTALELLELCVDMLVACMRKLQRKDMTKQTSNSQDKL